MIGSFRLLGYSSISTVALGLLCVFLLLRVSA